MFRLNTYCANLFSLPLQDYNLVFCNHLIDDLVAADFANNQSLDFHNSIFNSPENQQQLWSQITRESAIETTTKFAQKLMELPLGSKSVINHYQANFDLVNQITNKDHLITDLFLHLRKLLIEGSFEEFKLKSNITLPKNELWLIMERK